MKEGWEYKKLGEVADFYRGLTYKREDEVDSSDNCVLRSNNIDLESMSLNFDELKYIRPDFVIPEDKKLRANSVFVCMSNGSKQHVGKVAYVKEDMDYAFGGFMGLIVPKREVEGKFIYYVCRSSIYRHFLTQIGNGIGITNLRFSDLNDFSLPIPSPSEQQHVVEELDLLSSILEKKKAQLNELDNLAQSLFYEMFGDPITNEKGWEVKKLADISKEKLSYGSGASAITYDGKLRYIRITDINDSGELNDNMVSPNSFDEKYVLNDGDILFARSGATVGKTYYHKEKYGKCIYAGYLIRLIPNADIVLPSYVFGYTKTQYYMEFVKSAQNAVAQPNINAKQYGNLDICIPPLSLQQQFASKIEAIEHQKELIKQSIKEVETLFNSRMDYYFN